MSAPALRLPLSGRRVVVTRALDQSTSLLSRLGALGADAISLPTIAIAPATEPMHLLYALRAWSQFHLCIFASANAVRSVASQTRIAHVDLQSGPQPFICAIGPATAAAWLLASGRKPDLVPKEFNSEGMLAALEAMPMRDRTVFLPSAEGGREEIAQVLMRRGAIVTRVPAYRTVLAASSQGLARALFPGADAVVCTSPSTARHLAVLLGDEYATRLGNIPLAAIGPRTRQEVERLGLQVSISAAEATEEALVEAIQEYFHARTARG